MVSLLIQAASLASTSVARDQDLSRVVMSVKANRSMDVVLACLERVF